ANRPDANDGLCLAIAMCRVAPDRCAHRRSRASHGGKEVRDGVLRPGSAGCQPAAFGGLAECIFARSARARSRINCETEVRGKLPRTTGWQPLLPGNRNATQ